jgi:asparagine synthase (glutamine-hydrolysing)
MTININIETDFLWSKYCVGTTNIHIKGYIYSHTVNDILNHASVLKRDDVESFLKSLDGCFAIIVQKGEFTLIAVDKVRSTPIFFTKIKGCYYIDCNPTNLVERNGFNKYVNDDAILEFRMSGYTIGNKTVYKNLYSLKAGELAVFGKNNSKYIQYYKYFGDIEYKGYNDYIEELSEVTINIFKKMLDQIGGRQIIIPLSAGNDSRLVASALKHLGATNVKCYSYGSMGNFEAKIAEIIAKKLGYEWMFVPLNYKSEKKYYASQDYKEYAKFSETYCSIPYIQSLSTIKYLKDMKWVNEDAFFVNGNSGDFISGAHINLLKDNDCNSKAQRKENILNNLINKHFSLWGHYKTEKNVEKIKNSLWNEIVLACGNDLKNKEKDHLFYEYSEFIDRQSKYVIAGQRVYEFYGYEWRMPLWDNEYLYFWQKVPVEFKKNQKLYSDMLKKKNFGNVWGDDILVNKKNITPKWVIPFRLLVKVFFSLFGNYGKTSWKQFDKVVFNYWMINTHTMKAFSYLRVLSDFNKKPRGISPCWSSDDYVSKLKLKSIKSTK